MEVPFDGRVPPPGGRDAVAGRLRGALRRPVRLAATRARPALAAPAT